MADAPGSLVNQNLVFSIVNFQAGSAVIIVPVGQLAGVLCGQKPVINFPWLGQMQPAQMWQG